MSSKLYQMLTCICYLNKSMRCEVYYICKKCSKANNNYLKSYDLKNELKQFMQLGANNLYCYVSSKFLPTSGLKWIDSKYFDLNKYSSNSFTGCVLEVDFKYPKNLHELQGNHSLALDKKGIKIEMLSNYQIKIVDFYNNSIGTFKKLVLNFFEKKVLHYENFQGYRRLLLKLKIYIQNSINYNG